MVPRIRCPYCRGLLDLESGEDLGARRTCPMCRIAITEPLTVEGSPGAALLGALMGASACLFGELILINVGAFVYGLFSHDPEWNVAQGGASCACMVSILLAPFAFAAGGLVAAFLCWRWSRRRCGRP